MDVVSSCSLRASSLVWQSRPGTWTLTVVCKATYVLSPGESRLAETQDEPLEADAYWDDDERGSLRAAGDLAPFKKRADVVLTGHAYAPHRQPVASVVTRIVVGEIDKAIEVFGDRSWTQDGQMREGPRFTRLPLRWERAAGGPESTNPVGVRADADPDRYGMIPIPNLIPPGRHLSTPREHVDSVGYGPIAPRWPSRRARLYQLAGAWPYPGCFQQPFPDGIDAAYFNVAPPDQQLEVIRTSEQIILENLHPEHPRLVTSLPASPAPRAMVERLNGYGEQLALRCDTLAIDTDRGVCTLTWRGQLALEHPTQQGRVVISVDGAPSQPRRPVIMPGARASHTLDASAIERARAALPFSGFGPPPSAPPPSATPPSFDPSRTGGFPFRGPPAPESTPSWPQQAPSAGPAGESGVFRPPAPMGESGVFRPPAPMGESGVFRPPAPMGESGVFRPPMVRPPVSSEPVVPPIASSVWSGGDARPSSNLSVGQIAAPQPVDVPPPSVDRWVPPSSPSSPSMLSSLSSDTRARSGGESGGLSIGQMVAAQPAEVSRGSVQDGAAAASNVAALAGFAPASAPRSEPTPARGQPAVDARTAVRAEPRTEVLQFVWLDPEAMPRIRRKEAWRTILTELEDTLPDPETEDPALAKDPAEIEDRRDVLAVLARADVVDGDGLNEAINAGMRDDGCFMPRLVLIAGELVFPFDELEVLKATVTTASPIAGNDENLKATIEAAKDFLRTPELRSAPAVAEGLTTRIKEAFAGGRRAVPAGYLDTQTERVLLDQRCYQKRSLLGAPHIRALLTVPGAAAPVPTYLPESIAKKLPLYQRFRARMIVEVNLAVDQYESHTAALAVAALARLAPTGQAAQSARK